MCYLQKYVLQKKQKMITNKNEAKAMAERISRDCKCKFNATICNSNKK